MKDNLVFYAGRKAFEIIRDEGLKPDRISVVAGAAGGPKWLVLRHLDKAVFSEWFHGRTSPLFLIGSSIGAWRFAGQCMADPQSSLSDFESAYIHQAYIGKPSPETVSRESTRIQEAFLKDRGSWEILNHPYLRLNFMAVRCKGLAASDSRLLLATALLIAAMGNLVSRSLLKIFFERVLFYDSRNPPPFFKITGFPIHQVPLTPDNLPRALLASGSIPWVMSGVKNIPVSPSGVYRDGGVIDYHMDIPLSSRTDGLTLFPHYMERVIPGWLDKKLTWRKPGARNMENVLLLAPSPQFVDRLPYHKIPDRNDFYRFDGQDSQRFAYWNAVVEAGQVLADEFMDAALGGSIRNKVRPWNFL
jgi:hypothetical protein